MEIVFEKQYLSELYYKGKCSDKQHRYQPDIVKRYNEIDMGKLGYAAMPTHPGEVVKDELEARNISQREFAQRVGISYSMLNEIVNARRSMSANDALMFEATLGIPADALMQIQTKYTMQTARRDSSITDWLKQISKVAALW